MYRLVFEKKIYEIKDVIYVHSIRNSIEILKV